MFKNDLHILKYNLYVDRKNYKLNLIFQIKSLFNQLFNHFHALAGLILNQHSIQYLKQIRK